MSAKNYWIPFDWARESLNVSRTTIRDIFQAWGLVVLQGYNVFIPRRGKELLGQYVP
jgi:hypothetical protein